MIGPLVHPKDVEKYIVDNEIKCIFIEFPTSDKNLKFSEDLEETFFNDNEVGQFNIIMAPDGRFILEIKITKENINRLKYMIKKHNLENIKILNMNKNILRAPQKRREPLSSSLRHEAFKRDNYKCLECGVSKNEASLHIDHIIPKSEGGTDELVNLQTLCDKCNLSKSNRKWVGGNNSGS